MGEGNSLLNDPRIFVKDIQSGRTLRVIRPMCPCKNFVIFIESRKLEYDPELDMLLRETTALFRPIRLPIQIFFLVFNNYLDDCYYTTNKHFFSLSSHRH